jgi:ankyrin repeat protein
LWSDNCFSLRSLSKGLNVGGQPVGEWDIKALANRYSIPLHNQFMVDFRDLLQKALQSNTHFTALEAMVHDHPDLPEALGKLWADGFGADQIPPAVARFLVERGAQLSVHAAAGFGFTDILSDLLRGDSLQVNAKGGDGCTPLHFARDVATAQLLLDHGANIDPRDEDHDSTPAQWRIGKAPEVSRFLLDRGAAPDIFLAAALGDIDLAAKLISQNPACVAHRIGRLPDFPPVGHNGRGGTILQWTLAFNSYPHQIALLKGHADLFDFLFENSDPQTRLLVCCVLARRQDAEAIHRQYPNLVANLPSLDLELLPRYCWETNTSYEAVRLMLDLGFPIAYTESSHGYSPLHNAAWSGDAALVDLLISRGHPVDLVDPSFNSTPLGYAIHDCIVAKRHPEGNFARVVESLLKAGSPWKPSIYPTGDQRVDEVLARFR